MIKSVGERAYLVRKIVFSLLCLSVSVVSLEGCNRAAGQHAAAAKELSQAIDILNQANQGYVPKTGSGSGLATIAAYRQQMMAKAVAPLQDVLTKGSKTQEVAARRLLAQISTSKANTLAAVAGGSYGTLAAGSNVFVSDAMSVTGAADRAVTLKVDNSDAVKSLQVTAEELTKKQADLQSEIKTAQQARDDQQSQIDQLKQTASKLMSQAQTLSENAMAAESGKKYQMLDRASSLRKKAHSALHQAALHGLTLTGHAHTLDLLTKKKALADEALKLVNDRIASFESEQTSMDAKRQMADQQTQAAGQAMLKKFEQLNKSFAANVDGPYSKAADAIAHAVDMLTKAKADASGSYREDADLDLLSSYIDQARILGAHARATGGYAELVKLAKTAVGKALGDKDAELGKTISDLEAKQKTLTASANSAIAAGEKLAATLKGGSGDMAKLVSEQKQLLDQYKKRVAASGA